MKGSNSPLEFSKNNLEEHMNPFTLKRSSNSNSESLKMYDNTSSGFNRNQEQSDNIQKHSNSKNDLKTRLKKNNKIKVIQNNQINFSKTSKANFANQGAFN